MKIKVCGMRDPANIAEVGLLRPDYMGFIFYDRSPRFAGNMESSVMNAVPDGIIKVGVFVDAPLEYITDICGKYSLDAVQLHGNESPEKCAALKGRYMVIKAFGIENAEDLEPVRRYEGTCDYFLFDTKTPSRGGSGQKFEHGVLLSYKGSIPFFLSGGIGPADAAPESPCPVCCAVDINSKFELSPGIKDVGKLREFFSKIRNK